VNPFQFFGEGELVGAERGADEDVGVGEFLGEAVEVGEMNDAHVGPAFADGSGHHLVGAPLGERMPDADDELGVSGLRANDGQRGLPRAWAWPFCRAARGAVPKREE
jgi:hypothetical protein